MERIDTEPRNPTPTPRAVARTDRGLALFGVLILIVIFTLLGVGAVSLAQRESRNSGSVLDIKSRQSGAYAGIVFALGEFQRDPDNFAALLEAWRTKSVALYGTLTKPLPPLYLSFSATGANVALTKTKPAPFPIPGSAYRTVVELAGVQVPAPGGSPVVVLRATGNGRSGDEQTVLGAYAVRNIRMNGGGGGAALGITHPFFIKGSGAATWNNKLETNGGDVFIGGPMHFNTATGAINIRGGGLKIKGGLDWDAGLAITIDSSSWVAGNLDVRNALVRFRKHLVVDGNTRWVDNTLLTVDGSMLIRGTGGITDIRGGSLRVGSDTINPSQLAVVRGPLTTTTGGATIDVTGDAYFRQIASDPSKAMTLNVTRRLELSENPTLEQDFYGNGTWGQFVARDLKAGSSVVVSTGAINIGDFGTSWVKDASKLSMGWGGTAIAFGAAKVNRPACVGTCPPSWNVSGSSPVVVTNFLPAGVSSVVNADGFDAAKPPVTPALLGMSVSPDSVKEVGFDLAKDPSIELKALSLSAGGGLCQFPLTLCGASLNKARTDAIAAGSNHFHNGYFVVKIESGQFGWDQGGLMTSPLVGKWLIIVKKELTSGASIWPTTASNPDPTNPANIQFIYVPATGGGITAGFQPRHMNPETVLPVPFYGYVRVDGAPGTWDPTTSVDFQGAIHFMHPTQSLTANSGDGSLPAMTLNQAVLNSIGGAFGSLFLDKNTGLPLAPPGPEGFVATENWIQFQPLAELR
jgi:hypothetical protein